MKHVSHYVLPGAKRIQTEGAYDDVLAFINPDGSIAVIVGNNADSDKIISLNVQNEIFTPTLKAHSLNTFLF